MVMDVRDRSAKCCAAEQTGNLGKTYNVIGFVKARCQFRSYYKHSERGNTYTTKERCHCLGKNSDMAKKKKMLQWMVLNIIKNFVKGSSHTKKKLRGP
jgi:hypothetical protein